MWWYPGRYSDSATLFQSLECSSQISVHLQHSSHLKENKFILSPLGTHTQVDLTTWFCGFLQSQNKKEAYNIHHSGGDSRQMDYSNREELHCMFQMLSDDILSLGLVEAGDLLN